MDNLLYSTATLFQNELVNSIKRGFNDYNAMMFESRRKNLIESEIPAQFIPEWLLNKHSLGSTIQWLKSYDSVVDNRINFIYDSLQPLLNFLQTKSSGIDMYDKVYNLQNLLIKIATSGYDAAADKEYQQLRVELTRITGLKNLLPELVKLHRDLMEFWQFIKKKFPTYQERREFLYAEFKPVLDALEKNEGSPIELTATEMLKRYGSNYIHDEWSKMLQRRNTDNEGAITSSRALVETVLKYILDERYVTYDEKAELPTLYKTVAKELNLSPDQHTEQIFKQILGGCQTVVEGLGALRNAHGDAHGKSQVRKKPDKRHSDLAINLAGTMANFLLETFDSVPKASAVVE
jgi:hypothetical protein